MKHWAFALALMFSAHAAYAEPPTQVFEGRLQWSCLGNWLYQTNANKAFAVIFDDNALKAHPELRMPDFPVAAAATYEAAFEGTVITEPSCYPKAPCDWRTWPGSDKIEHAGCIHVTGIKKLARERSQPKAGPE
jgi:hypothetical protein